MFRFEAVDRLGETLGRFTTREAALNAIADHCYAGVATAGGRVEFWPNHEVVWFYAETDRACDQGEVWSVVEVQS